jgi:Fic family protein
MNDSGITVSEWLAAEEKLKQRRVLEKPKNGVTADDYAKIRGISYSHASRILRDMHREGIATRTAWNRTFVYLLK